MIKICYVALTLMTGQPALVNFNEVIAVSENSIFGSLNTDIIFVSSSGESRITIKNTVEEIVDKLERCNKTSEHFVFVGK